MSKKKRYRAICSCDGCDYAWQTIIPSLDEMPNNCPKCGRKVGRSHTEAEHKEKRTPVTRRGNNNTKAVDMTAEIVMKDYGMTDLKDNVRVGETCAPKLHPKLQAQADSMFAGKGAKRGMLPRNANMLGQMAIKGAFQRPAIDPIAAVHSARHQVVTTIISEKPQK